MNSVAYALSTRPGNVKVLMHHLILPPKPDWYVIHRDHNGLNNRRSNLMDGDTTLRAHYNLHSAQ